MEFHALLGLSLPLVLQVQDALIGVGVGVALLASLAFINLGTLLPSLLTSLGGPQPGQRGAYLEFDPAGAPIISGLTARGVPSLESRPDRHPVAPPNRSQRILVGRRSQLASPIGLVRQ
jgi:hypothetical protein